MACECAWLVKAFEANATKTICERVNHFYVLVALFCPPTIIALEHSHRVSGTAGVAENVPAVSAMMATPD